MRRSVLALLICSSLTVPALAVTVVPLSFDQLVNQSSAVVYGRVAGVQARWTADRRGIESVVTIEVLKGFKGRQGDTVSLTLPGGQLGRYVNVIPGAPSFRRGDLAVFFLKSRGARLPVTTGFTQGIYRVRSSGGTLLVMAPVVDSGAGRIVRGDVRRKPVSLAAFESSVRAIADQAR